jgi:hypothetical protein
MAIELVPLPLPAKADRVKMAEIGREVKGVDPKNVTPEQFAQIREALYKVGAFGSDVIDNRLTFRTYLARGYLIP